MQQVEIKASIKQPYSKEFKMVDRRLRNWGYWYTNSLDELNYPKQVSFLNKPRDPISAPKQRDIKDDPEAEEINTIVIELRRRHPQWEAAVRGQYTVMGKSQGQKAKVLGVSRPKFISLVDLGKAWIEARLD